MANISPDQAAARLLAACLSNQPWSTDDLDILVDSNSDALFSIVAEGLADRFDPRLTDAYVAIFSYAIARVDARFTAEELRAHYAHVRRVWEYKHAISAKQRILEVEQRALRTLRTGGATYHVPGIVPTPPVEDDPEPERIVLLSRITLGADIAVTSIVAQALRARFPHAEILLAGSAKSAELLGLPLLPVDYPRTGGLRARLKCAGVIAELHPDTLVIDPDSRISQLGLYPVAPSPRRYYFFDSRSIEHPGSLVELTRDWCAQVFEVDIPWPKIETQVPPFEFARPAITVSLGVGGNESKRIGGDFERNLIRELSSRASSVIIDKGAGEEEARRAEAASAGIPNIRLFEGSFAAFASLIANSDLYVGYDSAGQHAAAALGIPLISIFAGAVNDRFFERWRPDGRVLRIDCGSPDANFIRFRSLLNREPEFASPTRPSES